MINVERAASALPNIGSGREGLGLARLLPGSSQQIVLFAISWYSDPVFISFSSRVNDLASIELVLKLFEVVPVAIAELLGDFEQLLEPREVELGD